MSLGIYPVFKPELIGTQINILGEVLVSNFDALDKIAQTAKLTPIYAFADNRPVPSNFDSDPDDLAEVMGEWTEWFNPAEGQIVMQAIADYIKDHPKVAKRLKHADEVVAELEEMSRILKVAAKQSVKFRLHMS